jgi:hypothetical protein
MGTRRKIARHSVQREAKSIFKEHVMRSEREGESRRAISDWGMKYYCGPAALSGALSGVFIKKAFIVLLRPLIYCVPPLCLSMNNAIIIINTHRLRPLLLWEKD